LVLTQHVLTLLLHVPPQYLQSYIQAVPQTMPYRPFQFDLCWSSRHFILREPNDNVMKPRLKAQPYYKVAFSRHLHLLRYFSLSLRQTLPVYCLTILQHSDLCMYSLLQHSVTHFTYKILTYLL
jgi:hypothetical protein